MWQPIVDKRTGRRLIKQQAILVAVGLVTYKFIEWITDPWLPALARQGVRYILGSS